MCVGYYRRRFIMKAQSHDSGPCNSVDDGRSERGEPRWMLPVAAPDQHPDCLLFPPAMSDQWYAARRNSRIEPNPPSFHSPVYDLSATRFWTCRVVV